MEILGSGMVETPDTNEFIKKLMEPWSFKLIQNEFSSKYYENN